MQKLLLLLSIFFYTTTLFGAYDVKIGVYKNTKNLRLNIAKIKSSKYRNYIVIDKKNKLNYVHAVIESNVEAKKALHAYKRVFRDAFISKRQIQVKITAKKTSKKTSVALSKKKSNEKVKGKEKIQNLNAKALLANKTIYLCYEKGPKHLQERMVQMVFEEEHVIYSPLTKMSTPVKMPYVFKDNNLTLHLSDMKIVHNMYKQESGVLYAKSVIDGLVVNTLRYYFDKSLALAYIENH